MRILMAGNGSGGKHNFERTVLHPVELVRYRESLTESQWQLLHGRHCQTARVWGIAAG